VIAALPRPLVAGLAVAALGGAIAVQSARDRWYPRAEAARTRVLYVRSPAAMKRLAFGFQALAADVYWIRAIQHYGGDRLVRGPDSAGRRYELLYPLLDITTSLDPYFNIAYRFGAIFLGEPYPGGPGRPDLAVALLRKATAAMPQKWQYYHDIGFVYYWRMRDYKTASEWFQRAAAQPDAPNWLPSLAASMLSRTNDRATARFMWQQLLKSEQPWVRRTAERSLLQLEALDQIDQLQAAVARAGPDPLRGYSWSVLIARRMLAGVPLDPTRAPYVLDPGTGRVQVNPESPLFPMPEEAGAPR
jgi:tetratricopeptide (TPR) repeat protein